MKTVRQHVLRCVLSMCALGMFASGAQAIDTAGTLLVDLDARHPSAGTASWFNAGTIGDFVEAGNPAVGTFGPNNNPAVDFDSSGGIDAYRSQGNSPASVVGQNPTRSIEVWVYNPTQNGEETTVAWGRRGGGNGTNMGFLYTPSNSFGAVGHWGGGPDVPWSPAGGAPALGQWNHLVYVHNGDSTIVYENGLRANHEYHRDRGNNNPFLNTHPNQLINIAAQNANAGNDLDGGTRGQLAIANVRVHDGALNPLQVMNNFNEDAGRFGLTAMEVNPFSPAPVNRYSFDNAAGAAPDGTVLIDSIGGQHGVVRGAGASADGSQLSLPGGSGATQAYGDLPNGLISTKTDLTIEAWVTIDGAQNWQRIFDFGSSGNAEVLGPGGGGQGTDYLMVSGARGGNALQARIEVRNVDPMGGGPGDINTLDLARPGINQEFHFALVFDADGNGGSPQISYYRDGVLLDTLNTNIQLANLNDVNNWLGRSNWTADANFQGSFNEFRIYDVALDGKQIAGNFLLGPDTLNLEQAVPEPATAALGLIGVALIASRRRRRTA